MFLWEFEFIIVSALGTFRTPIITVGPFRTPIITVGVPNSNILSWPVPNCNYLSSERGPRLFQNLIRPVTVVCLVRRPEWSSLSPSRAPASRAALVAGSQFAAAGRPRRRSGPGGAAGPIQFLLDPLAEDPGCLGWHALDRATADNDTAAASALSASAASACAASANAAAASKAAPRRQARRRQALWRQA
jgi:hypothetical protein